MNRNYQNYKETMSAFLPSEKSVEKIFEMLSENETGKSRRIINMKRMAAAAMAFVLIIGGGFGVHSVFSKRNAVSDKLGVMVAMAGEKELLTAGQMNEQDVFYGLYIADFNDSQALADARNRWNNDKNKQCDIAEKLGANHITAGIKSGNDEAYNEKIDQYTAAMYTLSAGSFVLSLSDYTNVKDITVENTSRYGMISAEYWNNSYDLSEMDKNVYSEAFGEVNGYWDVQEYSFGRDEKKIVLTKEDLMFSIDNHFGCYDTAFGEENKGYTVVWQISEYLKKAIGENVHFDLSQIEDTILFTVNYDDGTSEQAGVNLRFDSDGYMHITDAES